jgi:hypothetical protein
VDDLKIFLNEERLPDQWETKARFSRGLTIFSFNTLVNKVEFSIDEKRALKEEIASSPPPDQ